MTAEFLRVRRDRGGMESAQGKHAGRHLQQAQHASKRTEDLQSRGYRVLRFWNNDVLNNVDGVLRLIHESLVKP